MTERVIHISPNSLDYSARFGACMAFVGPQEGGDDFDKHDPGGRTSRGIIQREYDAYRRLRGESTQSVWKATDLELQEIYWNSYWEPNCVKLWPGLDLCFFDQCVNEGPPQAIRDLQRALRVTVTGHFDYATQHAASIVIDRAALIQRYSDLRLGFYRHLRNFTWFGKDWTRREDECHVAALRMLTPGTMTA